MIKVRLLYLLGIAICFSIFVQGCNSSSNKWEKEHPDPDRLPADEEVDYSLDISRSNGDPLPGFFHPDSLKHLATIGSDTSLDEKYYHVGFRKLDMDDQGNIYIIQYRYNTNIMNIKVYDTHGQHLYTIGRAGRGPGEFLYLRSFAFGDEYRTLYVLDAFEIEIFVRNGDRFEYENTVNHGLLRPFDICSLGDDLFVSGYKIAVEEMNPDNPSTGHDLKAEVTPPITRIETETFNATGSFGYEYKSYSGYGTFDGILSETMLSCNKASKTIVGYQKYFPYIFGYDRDGTQKWVSKTEGYRVPRHIESKTPEYRNPGLIQRANEETFDLKTSVQKIYHGRYELLQLVNMAPHPTLQPAGFEEERTFRSILLDTETGEQFYSDIYKKQIGVKKNGIVVTIERNPETFQLKFQIHEMD